MRPGCRVVQTGGTPRADAATLAAIDAGRDRPQGHEGPSGPRHLKSDVKIVPAGVVCARLVLVLRTRVDVWHGTEDTVVRPRMGELLVHRLPRARPRFVRGGHFSIGLEHLAEILAGLFESRRRAAIADGGRPRTRSAPVRSPVAMPLTTTR